MSSTKPFSNIKFCCTSVAGELRLEISNKIRAMGGVYCNNLMSDVNVLIVGDRNTPKFSFSVQKRFDIVFIRPGAVLELHRQWIEGKNVLSGAVGEPYGFLPRMRVFDGLTVCISRVNAEEIKGNLAQQINANGGVSTDSLTSRTAYLVTCEKSGKRYSKALEWNIPVVHPNWVRDSLKRGAVLDPIYYDISTVSIDKIGSGACLVWDELDKLSRNPAGVVSKKRRLLGLDDTRNLDDELDMNDTEEIQQTKKNKSSLNAWNSIINNSHANTLQSIVHEKVGKPVEKIEKPVEKPIEKPENKPSKQDLFKDMRFMIDGFNEKHAKVLNSIIKSHGGSITSWDSLLAMKQDYLLVPHDLKDDKRHLEKIMSEIGETLPFVGNNRRIDEISDNNREMDEISDNNREMDEISDNNREMDKISDNNRKTDQITDNNRKIDQITDNNRKIDQITDNNRKMDKITDNNRKIDQITDNNQKINTKLPFVDNNQKINTKLPFTVVTEWFVERSLYYHQIKDDLWGKPMSIYEPLRSCKDLDKKVNVSISGFSGSELLHLEKLLACLDHIIIFNDRLTKKTDLLIINTSLIGLNEENSKQLFQNTSNGIKTLLKDVECNRISLQSMKKKLIFCQTNSIPIFSLNFLFEIFITCHGANAYENLSNIKLNDLKWCIFFPKKLNTREDNALLQFVDKYLKQESDKSNEKRKEWGKLSGKASESSLNHTMGADDEQVSEKLPENPPEDDIGTQIVYGKVRKVNSLKRNRGIDIY